METFERIRNSVPKRVIVLLIIVTGLIVSLYLLREQQLFTLQASSDTVEIKDEQGNSLPLEWGTPVTGETTILIELKEAPEP